ncbi:optic atrophy 3 protein homolog [Brassica rapa]|uniref:OPA3-like protein n=1 Tax=Brassica campestris TaxID=3711 RepID=M4DDL5_BRACM|nr:optic atrophy 3 protein homolog [Brassica rapa]
MSSKSSNSRTLLQQGMVFPLVKLGSLALRTICKPIANRLKKQAGINPGFRQFIVNIAQANHRFTTKLQRQASGRVTDAIIRPLNEERAVQAAADLLGEIFAFTVAGAALVYEVQRNARGEARKEEKRQEELQEFRLRHKKMENEVEEMNQRISMISEALSKQQLAEEEALSKQKALAAQELSKQRKPAEDVSKPRGLAWLYSFVYCGSAPGKES